MKRGRVKKEEKAQSAVDQLINERWEKKQSNDYGFSEYAHMLDQIEDGDDMDELNPDPLLKASEKVEMDIYATNPEYQALDETNFFEQLAMLVNMYVGETKGVKTNNVFDSETQSFVINPPVFH